MSNGRKQNDDRDVDEDDTTDVSGGINPSDLGGFVPTPQGDGEVPYPRAPGGPIVKIDPPEDPTFEWKNIYKV